MEAPETSIPGETRTTQRLKDGDHIELEGPEVQYNDQVMPRLKSITYRGPWQGSRRRSVGIISAWNGTYDFGTAETRETLNVRHGELEVNGKTCRTGDVCIIEAGQQIRIKAREHAAYLCIYG